MAVCAHRVSVAGMVQDIQVKFLRVSRDQYPAVRNGLVGLDHYQIYDDMGVFGCGGFPALFH